MILSEELERKALLKNRRAQKGQTDTSVRATLVAIEEEVWVCDSCLKEMCGPGIYEEHKEDLSDEFKRSNIEKVEYEQISFL